MLTLQKAFSQLRLVIDAATVNASKCLQISALTHNASPQMRPLKPAPQSVSRVCALWYSTKPGRKKDEDDAKVKSYDPPSPYRNPGPRRYGYEPHFFTGGLLPRGLDSPVQSLPKYKQRNNWDRKRALKGQNDFIDILGDGSVKPVDLIKGPDWLIGFKGNELQRLKRRLKFHGEKLKALYPAKYHTIQKRVFFLYKKYNKKRGKRTG